MAVKAIAAITLALLAVVVTTIAWRTAIFDAYSRDFGSLTPARFESMNARMDLLERIARFSLFALAAADVVLVVVAFRKRAFVVFGMGIALAIVLALFLLIAQAAVGPAMIGLNQPSLVRHRVPEYSFCGGHTSQGGICRRNHVGSCSVELLFG